MEGDGGAQHNNVVLTINGTLSSYIVKGQFNGVNTHFVVEICLVLGWWKLRRTQTNAEPRSDSVQVRLLSTHSKSIVLKSGMKIGTLDRMEDRVIGGVKEQVLSSGITESMRQKLTDLVNQSEEGLSDEERTQLLGVLLEYHDTFAQGPGDVGCTGILKHSINTEGAQPIQQQSSANPSLPSG